MSINCSETRGATSVRSSEIIGALSVALDLTEGQPAGHAARSCIIGMKLASQRGLEVKEQSALFYALLLKDLGCSSNAAKMSYLFGADDRTLKRNVKSIDWQKLKANFKYVTNNVAPDGRTIDRILRVAALAIQGPKGPKSLIKIRCERGAKIARQLGFSELTAQAILELDEHWNGRGYPNGLAGNEISLLGRILGISQTIEVFWRENGIDAACQIVRDRAGTWFDPELVALFLTVSKEHEFQDSFNSIDPGFQLSCLEPESILRVADDDFLDQVALSFSEVVDAKSPWTYKHSIGVAQIATGMAEQLGFSVHERRILRRTALLHDLGKLGISNLILDKPGKLSDEEFQTMKQHPRMSEEILSRIESFAGVAAVAGVHHERLDGTGYFRGIPSGTLGIDSRVLMVADVFEAMTAKRPYRDGIPVDKVISILAGDVGKSICPDSFNALLKWLDKVQFESRVAFQLDKLQGLQNELANCSTCE